jgi:hypothetical protein
MAAYDLNPKPESRCNCGPRLLCLHGALVPAIPGSPQARTGPISRPSPPPIPASDITITEGKTNV